MNGTPEVSPETLTSLPYPLDFARMKPILAQIGLPVPSHISAVAAKSGHGEYVPGDFGLVLAEVDDALEKTKLTIESRIDFKAALTALGLLWG